MARGHVSWVGWDEEHGRYERYPLSCEPGERIVSVYRDGHGVKLVVDSHGQHSREDITFTLAEARELAAALTDIAGPEERAGQDFADFVDYSACAPYDVPGLPDEVLS